MEEQSNQTEKVDRKLNKIFWREDEIEERGGEMKKVRSLFLLERKREEEKYITKSINLLQFTAGQEFKRLKKTKRFVKTQALN